MYVADVLTEIKVKVKVQYTSPPYKNATAMSVNP